MKRIVIVGASSGIGREIALIYLQKGNRVAIAARRQEALEEIRLRYPDRCEAIAMDITQDDATDKLHQLIDRLGGMDLYLHCSGVGKQNATLDPAIELWTAGVNVDGFVRMTTAAYNYFKANQGGHITAISSIAGTKGLGVAPAYSATKRFQNSYLEALSQHARLEKTAITISDIRPGFVQTELLADGNNYFLVMPTHYAARKIVNSIERKRKKTIIDWRYALIVFFWQLIPRSLWIRLPVR